MKELLIATNNQGKVKEIKAILSDYYDHVYSLKDLDIDLDTVEDRDTFEGNARKKAFEAFLTSGMDTLADDSGLCVDALDGEPGVYSSRYAGEDATDADNNKKLVRMMKDVPEEKRTGKFVCTLCLIRNDKPELVANGEVNGVIVLEPKGENGFGYDPHFFVPQFSKTMAQLPSETKNTISHRANALEALKTVLRGEA